MGNDSSGEDRDPDQQTLKVAFSPKDVKAWRKHLE